MTHINRSALLPYPAEYLFELVNDIEAYPHYMEGCVGARVLKRDWQIIEARLDLAKGGVRQSFVTRNRLDVPKSIHMELLEGPFTHLDGRWFFQTLGEDACKVILDLQFKIANRVTALAARKLIESVSNNLVDAVCRRANELYSKQV
jgi:ribosome-associated toxin RatA of RatAB toxin-antitoxin module